ncbi:hypothetical protein H1R20_g3147, partial [Candolleomyces eurysporus]
MTFNLGTVGDPFQPDYGCSWPSRYKRASVLAHGLLSAGLAFATPPSRIYNTVDIERFCLFINLSILKPESTSSIMVQASTLLVAAAFVVAPVLAAPAPALPQYLESSAVNRRSIDNPDSLLDIEAREPSFWGSITKVSKKAAPATKLPKVALILRRDEEGNVYVRELSADELAYEAREPGFLKNLKSGGVKKVAKVASPVNPVKSGLGFRELDDGIYLEQREYASDFGLEERNLLDADDVLEVEARFLDELD